MAVLLSLSCCGKGPLSVALARSDGSGAWTLGVCGCSDRQICSLSVGAACIISHVLSSKTISVVRRIDELHTDYPFAPSRDIAVQCPVGHGVAG